MEPQSKRELKYWEAIEILDQIKTGKRSDSEIMAAINRILNMATINAVRKDLLRDALRYVVRERRIP